MTTIEEFLHAELEAWCAEFVKDRAYNLRNRKAKASGDLVNSLQYEVQAQALNASVEAIIFFEESGRFIDMRTLQPAEGGPDYIANIIKWMVSKGIKEKMIRGYMRRRSLKKVPDRVMTYIAFGIARKRFNGRYRPKRWYNKSKAAGLSEIFQNIMADLPDLITTELKKDFLQAARPVTSKRGASTARKSNLIKYAKAKGRE